MNWYKHAATADELKRWGVRIENGYAVLYRGSDVPGLQSEDLRYGDFLSSVSSGADSTGNLGADSYGKYVVEYKIPVKDVEVSNGELQYKGQAASLRGSKYPHEIYKAFNDFHGSNFTSHEIDSMTESEVRNTASMALGGGKDEYDALMQSFPPLA